MPTKAEENVKRLQRKQCNTVCPNCGQHKKFGFGNVCIKFYTFVCNECKSSHQAISHRCKSVTMSSWDDKEVAELARRGNDHCRRTWLKNAPREGTGGRPSPGMDIGVYKRFVVEAYEHRRYYGEDDGDQVELAAAAPTHMAVPVTARPSTSAAAAQRAASKKITVQQPVAAPAPRSAPVPPPVMDLLDFGAPAPAPTPPSAPATDLFQADFSSQATTSNNNNNNMFSADFQSAPSSAPASSSFPGLSKPPSAPSSSGTSIPPSTSQTSSTGLADFAGLSAIPAPAPSANKKKPIMGSGSSAISGLPGMQMQQQQLPAPPLMMPTPMMNNQFVAMQQRQQMMQMNNAMMNGGAMMNLGMMNGGMMMMNSGMNQPMMMAMNNGGMQQGMPMGGQPMMGGNMTMGFGNSNANGTSFGMMGMQQKRQQQQQQQQQQQKLTMNSMPGGDVFSTMNMFNK